MDSLSKLYKLPQTVFSSKELALIWGIANQNALNSRAHYYVSKGDLIRLRPGFFAKSGDYNPKELATKLYTPSYISFETVLRENGIIFQFESAITAASYLTRTIKVQNTNIKYRRITPKILLNPKGLITSELSTQASPERAFLDTLYLSPNYFFDNLRPINWEECLDLSGIYRKKGLIELVNKYRKKYVG